MRRVRINVGKIGIVTRNGDYNRVIQSGSHWLGFNEKVVLYDAGVIYTSQSDLNIMLRDARFASLVEVINVKDSEIYLRYENGNYQGILKPGRYFYFKGFREVEVQAF